MTEKNFTGPLERPNLAMYLEDLELTIRRVDEFVFQVEKYPRVLIRTIDEYVEDGDWGMRVSHVASFTDCSRREKSPCTNVSSLHTHKECYLLWSGGVESSVNTMFHNGHGDAGLRDLWFQSAIGLVRCRVLTRSAHFPNVVARTCQSVRKYAGLFGPTVFAEIHQLPALLTPDRFTKNEVDIQITQALVLAGIASGMGEDKALSFLAT